MSPPVTLRLEVVEEPIEGDLAEELRSVLLSHAVVRARYPSADMWIVAVDQLDKEGAEEGEFRADVAGRPQTFHAQNARDLRAFREGDFVILTLERRFGREVVTRFDRSRRD